MRIDINCSAPTHLYLYCTPCPFSDCVLNTRFGFLLLYSLFYTTHLVSCRFAETSVRFNAASVQRRCQRHGTVPTRFVSLRFSCVRLTRDPQSANFDAVLMRRRRRLLCCTRTNDLLRCAACFAAEFAGFPVIRLAVHWLCFALHCNSKCVSTSSCSSTSLD